VLSQEHGGSEVDALTLDMQNNEHLWRAARALASQETRQAAAQAADRKHLCKDGVTRDGMMERLLRKEYSKTEIDGMSPEDFTAASKKYRHNLMVRRAFLLGVQDAASAPRAQVFGAVMDSMRHITAARHGGMAKAAFAPMVSAPLATLSRRTCEVRWCYEPFTGEHAHPLHIVLLLFSSFITDSICHHISTLYR